LPICSRQSVKIKQNKIKTRRASPCPDQKKCHYFWSEKNAKLGVAIRSALEWQALFFFLMGCFGLES